MRVPPPIAMGIWEEHIPETSSTRLYAETVPARLAPSIRSHLQSAAHKISRCCRSGSQELVAQYSTAAEETVQVSHGIFTAALGVFPAFWRFLCHPVWVPTRREPKQHRRGVLFLLDVVRFGGTFAGIFLVSFLSLNFQSYWAIAESYIEPVTDITNGGSFSPAAATDTFADIAAVLAASPAREASDAGGVLPPVGPPDSRLIIPKLKLNVPIEKPPSDALISEDWKKLESDIQIALQSGVAHYPGSARPGQAGNFFVTGHSSYYTPGKYTSVFARLYQLSVGDEYWVYYGGDKFRYRITDKQEIQPSDVSVLDQPVHERVSTLMTCTPVGTTLRRLVVRAQEVDPTTGEPMKVGARAKAELPKVQMAVLPI